MRAAGDDCPG